MNKIFYHLKSSLISTFNNRLGYIQLFIASTKKIPYELEEEYNKAKEYFQKSIELKADG
jgi:hypothetical protein